MSIFTLEKWFVHYIILFAVCWVPSKSSICNRSMYLKVVASNGKTVLDECDSTSTHTKCALVVRNKRRRWSHTGKNEPSQQIKTIFVIPSWRKKGESPFFFAIVRQFGRMMHWRVHYLRGLRSLCPVTCLCVCCVCPCLHIAFVCVCVFVCRECSKQQRSATEQRHTQKKSRR